MDLWAIQTDRSAPGVADRWASYLVVASLVLPVVAIAAGNDKFVSSLTLTTAGDFASLEELPLHAGGPSSASDCCRKWSMDGDEFTKLRTYFNYNSHEPVDWKWIAKHAAKHVETEEVTLDNLAPEKNDLPKNALEWGKMSDGNAWLIRRSIEPYFGVNNRRGTIGTPVLSVVFVSDSNGPDFGGSAEQNLIKNSSAILPVVEAFRQKRNGKDKASLMSWLFNSKLFKKLFSKKSGVKPNGEDMQAVLHRNVPAIWTDSQSITHSVNDCYFNILTIHTKNTDWTSEKALKAGKYVVAAMERTDKHCHVNMPGLVDQQHDAIFEGIVTAVNKYSSMKHCNLDFMYFRKGHSRWQLAELQAKEQKQHSRTSTGKSVNDIIKEMEDAADQDAESRDDNPTSPPQNTTTSTSPIISAATPAPLPISSTPVAEPACQSTPPVRAADPPANPAPAVAPPGSIPPVSTASAAVGVVRLNRSRDSTKGDRPKKKRKHKHKKRRRDTYRRKHRKRRHSRRPDDDRDHERRRKSQKPARKPQEDPFGRRRYTREKRETWRRGIRGY